MVQIVGGFINVDEFAMLQHLGGFFIGFADVGWGVGLEDLCRGR